MSGKYVQHHDYPDYVEHPEPQMQNVWSFDMPMLGTHDSPCPVCMDKHAMLYRNMTPGRYFEIRQPCDSCQKKGWVTININKRLLGILKFFGLVKEEVFDQ